MSKYKKFFENYNEILKPLISGDVITPPFKSENFWVAEYLLRKTNTNEIKSGYPLRIPKNLREGRILNDISGYFHKFQTGSQFMKGLIEQEKYGSQ